MPAVCDMGAPPHCTTCRAAPARDGSELSSCSREGEMTTVGGGAAATMLRGRVMGRVLPEAEAPAQGGRAPVRGSVTPSPLLLLAPLPPLPGLVGRRMADMTKAGPQN